MTYPRKRILVTAGGTREYIDDVRVVTNISTGALGCLIAQEFLSMGDHVVFAHAKGSPMPEQPADNFGRLTTEQFVTTNDLYEIMRTYCTGFGLDAVIHSAAVSDFTFRRDVPVKVSSDDEEGFIEHLRQTIVRTPKIVREVKKWCPTCQLVSFKFTVGKSCTELRDIAYASGAAAGADYVLANDKIQMQSHGEHIGYLINTFAFKEFDGSSHASYRILHGKDMIARAIACTIHGNHVDAPAQNFEVKVS